MGLIYCVVPLEGEAAEWLDAEKIPYLIEGQPRAPRSCELRSALQRLESFAVSIREETPEGTWSAHIESSVPKVAAWSTLRVKNALTDDSPCEFYFAKGHVEVVFAVVKQLVPACGTMLVCNDSDAWPVVVSSQDSIEDLVERFNSPWPNDEDR